MNQSIVTASIVLHNTEENLVLNLIQSLSNCTITQVVVIDNSLTDFEYNIQWPSNFKYVKLSNNIGFGAAHNLAFKLLDSPSLGHLILNPDLVFDCDLASRMKEELLADPNLALLAPRIFYFNGTEQHLVRLLPSPMDLLIRRFLPDSILKRNLLKKYELKNLNRDVSAEVPIVSGCCFMIRSNIFEAVQGFDPRFFLYFEDFDLVRRASEFGRILYFPELSVFHGYNRESGRSLRLFFIHILSAIKYFNKWGWFFDARRRHINSFYF